jgi:hypothetical protein
MKKLSWRPIRATVTKTIKKIYKKGARFVSSYYIAEEIYKDRIFKNASYNATIIRVTTVLKDHMKFEVYSNQTKGRVFIVPERWWNYGKSN